MRLTKEKIEELVDEAMKIAMFDMPWSDESVPEVSAARKEFREAFRRVLKV